MNYAEKKDINIFKNINNDFKDFQKYLFNSINLSPGLYTYPIVQKDSRIMRVHLRINPKGNGVLFIDVTDVIHLNSTATLISKLALEGQSKKFTESYIFEKYKNVNVIKLRNQIVDIFEMIEHLSTHSGSCLTCNLSENIKKVPLFSLGVEAPYKVDLALTYACNNNCPHCYNETDRFSLQSLALKDWKNVIDKLLKLGVPHLIITGGEATLHPDLMDIIKYADSHGMIVGLNSNGRYLAQQKFMDKLVKSGLNHVQVTLGSHKEDVHNLIMATNSYKQTVAGIYSAIESGIHVITNTTLMRSNMDNVEDIIDFIFNLGIRTFAMNGMIYSGGGFSDTNAIHEKELPALLVRVRDHALSLGMRFLWYTPTEYCRLSPIELEIGAKRCNAGEYSLCIEPNGDVLPCQSYYVSAGNILNDPWDSIWNSELFTSFRKRDKDPAGSGLPEICWECPDLVLCGGGCRIEREARDGVRVSDDSGGGCSGCSGSCGAGHASSNIKLEHENNSNINSEGFQPYSSQTRKTTRSGGKSKGKINGIGYSKDEK